MIDIAYDRSAWSWVSEQIVTFAKDVGSLVPAGFEAYARVLHPAGPNGNVRWSDIARETGRRIHPEVQFQNVATPPGEVIPKSQWEVRGRWECPRTGDLSGSSRNRLGQLLSLFTSTPEQVWFAVWTGHGGLFPPTSPEQPQILRSVSRRRPGTSDRRQARGPGAESRSGPTPPPRVERDRVPLLELPKRDYLVFRGPLSELASWRLPGQICDLPSWAHPGPNLWWPDDRAWFVASEIDLVSTYVGGSKAAIEAVLQEHELEVVPSSVTHQITAAADRVNV